MAGHVMNKAYKNSVALLAALALAACQQSASNQSQAAPQGNLAGARIGGDFTLTDQDGKTVRWADFAGKYRIVYFGYTYCPDVCPLDLRDIMAGYRMLEKSDPVKAAKIQPIFITVDPQRDTPAVLKPYVSAFHKKLIGLTGTPEQIEAVKKAFVVVSSKEGDQKATQDYLVNHTRTPFLFGPDGKPIALVPIGEADAKEDASAVAVRDFLDQFVR
ncbi:SCO family protein [Sphingobium nicotianae]|uniref:SCO family protein n=1 Tax=Sphingobium nicotianae TaxID=2782607 RepID=A0A9X1DAQ9_9SPHN|nr:SCO family protein [Sphingobium nicotianae]MBT2186288.1 SCO family protein [Sphingobium nicotianae]